MERAGYLLINLLAACIGVYNSSYLAVMSGVTGIVLVIAWIVNDKGKR